MNDDMKVLKLIIKYCEGIENAMNRFGRDEEDFLGDTEYQYTCSFCLTQVGEMVKRLSARITEEHPEIPWNKIAGMRDIISHEYGKVNMNIVWITINERIPALKDTCEKILRQLEMT